MRKLFTIALCATMLFGIAGCGSSDKPSESSNKKEYVGEKDIAKAYSSPEKYKGMYIKLSGQVFSNPDKDEKAIYFQMWGNPEKYDLNTIVAYADPDMEVKADDFVMLEGKIVGTYEGENASGGSVEAMKVEADSVKIASYAEVIAPTIKTITPTGLSNSQNGVDISISKIEFAKNETRIYYTVVNNSGSAYTFYDFNMKIIQNGKQFEIISNYHAKYPSVSGEVLNGVKSDGIANFPVLSQEAFDIHIEKGYSDNYDLDFTDIAFNVSMK